MSTYSISIPFASKSFRVIERKLYPNTEQERTLEAYRVGCCRLYNRSLEHRIKAYRRRQESVSLYDQQSLLAKQRARVESLRAVPVVFLRSALHRLDKAFKAFFRRCKTADSRKGFPRFRSCRRYRSIEYAQVRNYFRAGTVFVPGIGEVTARGRDAVGKQKMLRLIKRIDTWYAQVLVEVQDVPPVEPQSSVGIDMGLAAFATLSTGEKIENPRWYRKAERELRAAQKSLSRKQKGSRNRAKARDRLASIHERISSQRKDFAHQESRKLVNRFGLIGFEELNIKGLARTRLAKSIMDAAWGLFLYFVSYKAANAGKHAVAVNAAGTSQECPWCGTVKKKSLSERQHRCECRDVVIDRDHASGLVIEARAVAVAAASNLWRKGPLARDALPALSPSCEAESPAVATQ